MREDFFVLVVSRNQRHEQQQNYRTDDRGDECSQCAEGNPADQPREPAAQHAADDADTQVDDKARAVAPHDEVCNPSRHKSYEQIPQQIHIFSLLFPTPVGVQKVCKSGCAIW